MFFLEWSEVLKHRFEFLFYLILNLYFLSVFYNKIDHFQAINHGYHPEVQRKLENHKNSTMSNTEVLTFSDLVSVV